MINETIEVGARQRRMWGFDLRDLSEVSVEMSVLEGDSVGFYVMTKDNYERYEKREQFRYYPDFSGEKVRGVRGRANLPHGEYVLVVENATYGFLSDGRSKVRLFATAELVKSQPTYDDDYGYPDNFDLYGDMTQEEIDDFHGGSAFD